MRGSRVTGIAVLVAALHLAGLSFALGPKCIPYIAAAYLTAVVVWGGVLMSTWKGRVGVIVGVGLSVAVQQVAYQIWKVELGGFWWPLAQFGALQLLIAVGISEVANRARRTDKLHEQ
jgi:hypothetical protein